MNIEYVKLPTYRYFDGITTPIITSLLPDSYILLRTNHKDCDNFFGYIFTSRITVDS